MTRKLLRSLPAATGPAVFAAASFLLLWPFARLDFDPYHDGYMLAQAMAVHEGGSIQSDAFTQYGPVTSWFQSVALFLPMGPALALRTINVVFIAVTLFLLADMGRKRPRGWPVSRAVGWWAAIAWVVLADIWMGIPMLPWSSTLAAMFSVAALYFVTRSMRFAEDGFIRAAFGTALLSGVCLGLMPFTRITVGISAVAVGLSVAALILVKEGSGPRKVGTAFVFGIFLSISAVISILAGTDSLADYYQQAIRWPLTWRQAATENLHTEAFLTSIFLFQATPVALACGVLFLQSRARTVQRGWSLSRSGVNVLTVLVGLMIVVWENMRIFFVTPEGASSRPAASSRVLEIFSGSNQYLYFFMVFAIVTSVLVCIFCVFRYVLHERLMGAPVAWLLLGGLALSGLTQIVPTFDPKHAWWGAPIGLLLVFSVVRATSQINRLSFNPLILPLLATAVMATVSAFTYAGLERVPGQSGTVIEGMLVTKAKSAQISQDTTFLSQHLRGSTSVIYLVNDGDLSILSGRYSSADAFFVDWGPTPRVQSRIVRGNPIVVQTSTSGERYVIELARSIKYQVMGENQRLAVLRPLPGVAQ